MKRQAKTPSTFQSIFFTVVALTLLSGAGSIGLSLPRDPSPQQERLFEICNTTWNLGIGAIFGLLGGTTPSKPDDDRPHHS